MRKASWSDRRMAAAVTLAGLMAVACAGAAPPPRPAPALDFTLINHTGLTLRAVYVSPASSAGWEDNVLAGDALPSGGAVEIRFDPREGAALWDLRVEDGSGRAAEWKGINLTEATRIRLRIDEGGRAVAETE